MKINKLFIAILASVIAGLFSGAARAAPPANDMWGAAEVIGGSSGTTLGLNMEATAQSCEPPHINSERDTGAKKTVWYKWTATESASYTFRLYFSDFDSILGAYRFDLGFCGSSMMSVPYRITENDQYNERFGNGNKSQVTIRATAGETIYLSVDSYTGSTGVFGLEWAKTRYKYHAQFDSTDGGTDLVVARTAGANIQWWMANSRGAGAAFENNSALTFGLAVSDKKLLGDFNGDGITDIAAVRAENGHLTWWLTDRRGYFLKALTFGLAGDRPIVGDYDGDGIADVAVTRAEGDNLKTWHILRSSDGQYRTLQFGWYTDYEMVGDYDGDGKTDLVAIRRTGAADKFTWYILRSSDAAVMTREFGQFGDYPQTADFDADGKTDICVFRRGFLNADQSWDGYWFSLPSSSPLPLAEVPTTYQKFGQSFDSPQAGDYDADGKTDPAVYRNGTWWIRQSRNGSVVAFSYGTSSDSPLADTGIAGAFYAF